MADAGPDQSVCDNEAVLLSGAASTDNDPAFVLVGSYLWYGAWDAVLVEYEGMEVQARGIPAGRHTLTLRATDPAGNAATDTITLTVADCTAPTVWLPTAAGAVEGQPFSVSASASTDVGNFTWSFEDGGQTRISYGPRFQHVFPTPGTVLLTVRVVDAAGHTANASCVVSVQDVTAPSIALPPRFDAPDRAPFVFTALTAADNDATFPSTATFTWTVSPANATGAGPTVQLFGPTPRHTFDSPGTFPVTLEVIDRAGNRAVASSEVVVSDTTAPQAQAGQDLAATQGEMVRFEATATDNDPAFGASAASRFVWRFDYAGQTVPLEGQNVTFAFERAGSYRVSLTVYDPSGNAATDELMVFVAPKAPDAWPLLHRALVVAAVAAVVLACVPFWLKAGRPPKGKA
jgi:PKD repeat protein